MTMSTITAAMLRDLKPGDALDLDKPLLPGFFPTAPEMICLAADRVAGSWSFEVRFLGVRLAEVRASRATARSKTIAWVTV